MLLRRSRELIGCAWQRTVDGRIRRVRVYALTRTMATYDVRATILSFSACRGGDSELRFGVAAGAGLVRIERAVACGRGQKRDRPGKIRFDGRAIRSVALR